MPDTKDNVPVVVRDTRLVNGFGFECNWEALHISKRARQPETDKRRFQAANRERLLNDFLRRSHNAVERAILEETKESGWEEVVLKVVEDRLDVVQFVDRC
jgi:hypothetical protein